MIRRCGRKMYKSVSVMTTTFYSIGLLQWVDRCSQARTRSMVCSTGARGETSSPRLRAIVLTRAGSSGMPPRSMAAISCRARSVSDGG